MFRWATWRTRRTFLGYRFSSEDVKYMLSSGKCCVFSSAASSDLRPRVAAQEAFDVAAAALPHTPNICFVNISLDHSDMLEAPGVIWGNLEKGEPKPTMIAQIVRQQRFGGSNFLEVLLGYIPSLTSELHPLDDLPSTMSKDCFLGIALLDWKLCSTYLGEINGRLAVASAACPAPIVGGVLSPAQNFDSHSTAEGAAPSIFAFNSGLVSGSASLIALNSSAMCPADVLQCVPSVPLTDALVVTDGTYLDQTWKIFTIGNRKATDVVRQLYEEKLSTWSPSLKIFAAVTLVSGEQIPLSFKGHAETGELHVTVPPALTEEIANFSKVSFVCDSPDHEREVIATDLDAVCKTLHPKSFVETVTIAREAKKNVTVSSAAILHWSNPQLYEVVTPARSGLTISVEGTLSTELHAPSIANRVLSGSIASTGIYCGAQVLPLASRRAADGLHRVSAVAARSSAHVVMRGYE